MSLAETLDQMRAAFATKVPADVAAIMHRATDDLRNSGILDGVVKTGDAMPAFDLPNQDGEQRSSAALLAKGPLVITFFRGFW